MHGCADGRTQDEARNKLRHHLIANDAHKLDEDMASKIAAEAEFIQGEEQWLEKD